MASKKELVEAQSFAKRRLTTAFIAGAPGGREVEPHRPMRAVFGGLALTLVLLLGSLAVGFVSGALPQNWQNNHLIIGKQSGARYVTVDGTLHPVANTTTARLLIPADSFILSRVDDRRLADKPRGATLGIPGAPDALPAADNLIPSGWTSCLNRAGTGVTSQVGGAAATPADDRAVLVSTEGDLFLVTGGVRYPVTGDPSRVLLALGLERTETLQAPAAWTNLFPLGAPVAPVAVAGAGESRPGLVAGATIGSVIVVGAEGSESRRYLIDSDGELVPLSPFANALYRAGTGQGIPDDIPVTAAQMGNIVVSPRDDFTSWPDEIPTAIESSACAVLSAGAEREPSVALGTVPGLEVSEQGRETLIADGGGALVRAVTEPSSTSGPIFLVDQSGRSYAIEGGGADLLERLGYTAADVVPVPAPWLELFTDGPVLSTEAAARELPQP